jgi:hypothetical protein
MAMKSAPNRKQNAPIVRTSAEVSRMTRAVEERAVTFTA